MANGYLKKLLTPSVREAEKRYYGRTYPSFEDSPDVDPLSEAEKHYIESRDSFYMATVTESGWPYMQHRGGPPGFLQVVDDNRIGFADYGGNRQMITVGSVESNGRVSLFLMDYPARQRLKILGTAEILDANDHPEWVERLAPENGHASKVERIVLIDVISYDWNCPKFISPRYSDSDVDALMSPLQERIRELEAEVQDCRNA